MIFAWSIAMNKKETKEFKTIPLSKKAREAKEFFETGGTFKDLQEMSDDSMESIYAVAYNLYTNKKYEEAIKIFQFLCFYDHYNNKYYLGLGSCFYMMGEYERSLEYLGFATVLNKDEVKSMLYAGKCHLQLKNKENAKVAFEAVINWAKDNPDCAEDKKIAAQLLSVLG